ncbi:hypothetical protein Tco_1121786 [Tanacetum coccineum]|uniref:Uncharacterized protein n=1 Tax=Tanacetum coccineum TaxID=301880 RepID=A0ABQ5IZ52_9ASTR
MGRLPKKYSKLTEAQQLQDDCDVQARIIILHGLPPDVYARQGEDPIDCINKAMAFLSVMASRFPPSNNQLITSSNPRNQATIQDGRVTVQQDTNSSAPNDLLVLSLVEQMTDHVANLDKENQKNKMVNESLTAKLERYKERVAIFEQSIGTDISQKDEKPIKKRQNRTRDGKVCGDEAKSK